MSVDLSKVTGILRKYAPQFWTDATTRNPYFYNMLQKSPATGARGAEWAIRHTGASAVGFKEGDALPSATEDDYVLADQPAGYFRSVMQLTGHAEDAIRNQDLVVLQGYIEEQTRSQVTGILKAVETALFGGVDANSGFVGMASFMDNTGTIAGINRAVYPAASPYVNANGGNTRALSLALMNTTANTMFITRQGRANAIFMPQNQVENWIALTTGGQKPIFNFNVDQAQANAPLALPVGFGSQNHLVPVSFFRGIPIYSLPGMSTDRVWFLDMSPDNIGLEVVRDIQVKQLAQNDDSMKWQISVGLALRVRDMFKGAAAIVDLSA